MFKIQFISVVIVNKKNMGGNDTKPALNSQQVSLLYFLKERGTVMKSELIRIVSSPPLLSNYLKLMEEQKLLTITENHEKHKKFFIKLTPSGYSMAKKLKEADDIASGKSIPKEMVFIELPEGIHKQILKILKIEREARSEEDFIIKAVEDKIKSWKKENPERG